MKKLSILICTLAKRKEMLEDLVYKLNLSYLHPDTSDFEILIDDSEFDTIGEKRNRLLSQAKGKYICFIDDDDSVSWNYVLLLMQGIEKDVDCCSLVGLYRVDGKDDGLFEHSIKYHKYKTNKQDEGVVLIKYERYPNHLNCIRASIAKQFKFPEKNWGEDTDWATQIKKSGLLKTEHIIDQIIYYYDKISKNVQPAR